MNSILIIDIILGVLLLLFAVGGFGRGVRAEVVTLAGILLGGLLTEQWADAWGSDLNSMAGVLGLATARFIVRLLLFLIPLLIIGYAGSLLLPSGLGKPSARTRIFGALLGLVNGAAILGFILRAYQYTYNESSPTSDLMVSAVAHTLLEWAGWWVLALALGGSVAVIVALTSRRPKTVKKPAVVPLGPATTSPASTLASASPSASTAPISGSQPFASLDQPLVSTGSSVAPLSGSSSSSTPSPATSPSYFSASPTPASASGQAVTIGPSDPTAVVPITGATGAAPTRGSVARRCRTCGKELLPGAAFCTNCGTPVE